MIWNVTRVSGNCQERSISPVGLPSFYRPPAASGRAAAGTLLKSQVLEVPGLEGTAHRVMYASSDEWDRSVLVTGLVFVPSLGPPRGGYPVVSWAHATNGMSDTCAPSRDPSTALPTLEMLNTLLEHRWLVAASDYQGEGTPPHLLPFLVGGVAGRNVLDIVAAARCLPALPVATRYVVWGYSEGGHAALFAWRLAKVFGAGRGLRLAGVVAGAPPSQLHYTFHRLEGTPGLLYFYMALAGFNAAYGDAAAPLERVLSDRGMALLPTLRSCGLERLFVEMAADRRPLLEADPFGLAPWRRLFSHNDPGCFTSGSEVPLLIVHGGADELIPTVTSAVLAQHLCAMGHEVERWVYPELPHGGDIGPSFEDVVGWMADRLAGKAHRARRPASGAEITVYAPWQ